MAIVRSALCAAVASTLAFPPAAQGQGSSDAEARARARFRQVDINEDGWLSGNELDACRCRGYDRNGDAEVTWAEFVRGEGAAAGDGGPAARPAPEAPAAPAARPVPAQAPAASGALRVGDRVEWNVGGVGYPGTIYNAEGGRYQVDRDGYGQAREWVSAADLRRLPQAAPAPRPAAAEPAAAAAAARFRPGHRVEVYADGVWYAATVVNVQDGRYRVRRDDQTYGVGSDEWLAENRLRPLAAAPTAARPAAGRLPQAVPAGVYDCDTYATGGGSPAGRLRILNGSVSSGITPDGSGPQYRYAYDATTGAIDWGGRLQVAGWTVVRAEYRPAADGRPVIILHYQRQRGGNLNSMSCMRG